MPFNSFEFFLFLLVVVLVYWLLGPRSRPVLLLVASYTFYAFQSLWLLPLLVAATLATYAIALRIPTASPRTSRLLLLLSISIPITALGAFKTLGLLSRAPGGEASALAPGLRAASLLVPIGLSFYTLQIISYSVDVYRKDLEPERSFVAYATFVAFFPHLLAGPIVRARRLIPQLVASRPAPSKQKMSEGLQLLLFGLFKKVAVADPLLASVSQSVRPAFNDAPTSTTSLMLGTTGLLIGVFFDIAGYMDMARGSAKLLGIELPTNFAQPLTRSTSFTDYWRRWQTTLMAWFRDYIYRPVRGGRGRRHEASAIIVTFVVAGAWHGLSVGWLIWGAVVGTVLVIERKTRFNARTEMHLAKRSGSVSRLLARLMLLVYVFAIYTLTIPWALSSTVAEGLTYYRLLATSGMSAPDLNLVVFIVYAIVVLVLSDRFERLGTLATSRAGIPLVRWAAMGAMAVGIVVFSGSAARDFVYVQF